MYRRNTIYSIVLKFQLHRGVPKSRNVYIRFFVNSMCNTSYLVFCNNDLYVCDDIKLYLAYCTEIYVIIRPLYVKLRRRNIIINNFKKLWSSSVC